LQADFLLSAARQADYRVNLEYALTAQNFNPIMALALDTVICQTAHIVPVVTIFPPSFTTRICWVDNHRFRLGFPGRESCSYTITRAFTARLSATEAPAMPPKMIISAVVATMIWTPFQFASAKIDI